MDNFWDGFEKQAKKKEKYKSSDKAKDIGLGTIGVIGSNTLAGVLVVPALSLDETLSAVDSAKLIRESNKGLKRKIFPTLLERGNIPVGGYDPVNHTIFSNNKAGVLSHEFGHARNMQGPFGKMNTFNKLRARYHGMAPLMAAGLLPVLGATSDNEKIQNLSQYAPLLGAPIILEEGAATLRGLTSIAKSLGGKRALKALPSLAAAFGTYASMPLAGAYAGKKILEKRRDKKS